MINESVPKYTKESMTALIEKRNAKFTAAVSELLVACAAHQPPEDPVALLLAATEENLPVKPGQDPEETKGLREKQDDLEFYQRNPEMRPSVEALIEEIKEQELYRDQIVDGGHRIFDAREGQIGQCDFWRSTDERRADSLDHRRARGAPFTRSRGRSLQHKAHHLPLLASSDRHQPPASVRLLGQESRQGSHHLDLDLLRQVAHLPDTRHQGVGGGSRGDSYLRVSDKGARSRPKEGAGGAVG